jgi:hypothetical protein
VQQHERNGPQADIDHAADDDLPKSHPAHRRQPPEQMDMDRLEQAQFPAIGGAVNVAQENGLVSVEGSEEGSEHNHCIGDAKQEDQKRSNRVSSR